MAGRAKNGKRINEKEPKTYHKLLVACCAKYRVAFLLLPMWRVCLLDQWQCHHIVMISG
jgi:hypothetical protein